MSRDNPMFASTCAPFLKFAFASCCSGARVSTSGFGSQPQGCLMPWNLFGLASLRDSKTDCTFSPRFRLPLPIIAAAALVGP